MSKQYTRFTLFKRNLYLWVLPIVILALSYELWFMGQDETFNKIAVPVLLFLFAFSWILFYKKFHFRVVEIINLLLISVLHILKTVDMIYVDMALNHEETLGDSTFWTPLIFIYIFVTLPGRIGIFYSIGLWSVMVFIGAFSWPDLPIDGINSLIQYLLACIVYVIFLLFARRIIQSYTESEILEKLAYQDSLTKIGNRRMIYNWLEKFVTQSKESDHTFSVIFFDIDHFKSINDKYGHGIGDKILVSLSSLIEENISDDDYFGRWGGEEFIIVLDGKTKKQANVLAEILREAIEEFPFLKGISVTSSFGVTHYNPGDTIDALLERADKALYVAKKSGRNRVQTYEYVEEQFN